MGVSMLDKVIGGLLAGSWLSTVFLSLEIHQAYRYWRNYPDDSTIHRIIVSSVLVLNVISTVMGNYASVYLYCITHWGDETYLDSSYWPLPTFLFATGLSTFLVQLFLTHRFYKLSGEIVITGVLFLFCIAALCGVLADAVVFIKFTSVSQRSRAVTTTIVWLVSSSMVDVFIAVALIWKLRTVQSPFQQTRSLVSRLIIYAIETGCTPAIINIIILVLFLVDQNANIAVGLSFSLGSLYSLTLLYNLNMRERSRQGLDGVTVSGSHIHSHNARMQNAFETMGGVHVLQTIHVDEDYARTGDSENRTVTSLMMSESKVDVEA